MEDKEIEELSKDVVEVCELIKNKINTPNTGEYQSFFIMSIFLFCRSSLKSMHNLFKDSYSSSPVFSEIEKVLNLKIEDEYRNILSTDLQIKKVVDI